ncbi:unnamed protein product [Symbiodinium necroappetens]|uniref:Uncharacterized protein n=2 Tax=Symbiodinium TaxID=2949 RepID=A0A812XSY5_9DINO|nr:hypothetical protein AK812_SmicGene30573 [Symbiodinium microadriaticum]CAE7745428.1 unnamed protein product [Symbiodinium necroappetens]CAE7878714.1 unnamed protein product [Symbiodinium microadriaticum]CAE7948541.1 unnamed protein product [Symbiodinium sp. KB8]
MVPKQARLRGAIVLVVAIVCCQMARSFLLHPSSLRTDVANRQDRPDRRSALQVLVAAISFSGAESAVAAASAPSKWAGRWDDPDAPGCKREIVMNFDGTKGRLTGTESTGMNPGFSAAEMAREKRVANTRKGCSRGDELKFWEAKLSAAGKDSNELTIDLSKSGIPGPKQVVVKWDGSGIVFPDGSKWSRGGSVAGGRGS